MSLKSFFVDSKKATFLTGAVILGVSSVVSRLLGLVRNRLLSGEFGTGFASDAYFAAFRLPDFLFNLLVLGALSSAFIPVFAEYLAKKKRDEAFMVARSLFTVMFFVLAVLTVVLFLFAEPLSYLVAADWVGEQRELLVRLIRIMLLSPLFFGLSNVLTGILNSFRRFVATAAAPVMYNVGIIAGLVFLTPTLGIEGAAWGVAFGSFLHLLTQVPTARRLGFSFMPAFQFFHEGVKKIFTLLLPRTIGMAMTQINLLIVAFLATRMEEGSLSQFQYATDLQSFPLGVFGFSFAVSAFPLLAEAASKNQESKFRSAFSHAFTQILFWLLPASAFLLLLREHLVRLVLGTGAFDWPATLATASALGFLGLSLFAQGLVPLLARTFYALQDTRTPVMVSILSLVLNIGLSFVFAPVLGVVGLALAFTLGTLVNLVVLLVWLRVRVGDLDDARLLRNTLIIVAATVVAGIAGFGAIRLTDPLLDTTRYLGLALQAFAALGVGALVYLSINRLFKLEELSGMFAAARARFRFKRS